MPPSPAWGRMTRGTGATGVIVAMTVPCVLIGVACVTGVIDEFGMIGVAGPSRRVGEAAAMMGVV